ncbi:uncharacterized protein PITG_13068 [Phytophthora infestans T30-4]|uniref:Uncharacterized protein n=1 Tax=Phytophthora infestans (strain T30-4) TaxID=403677 RepID=D0NK81_PHYIT|nr:uncharacterized protein PITG_13068 [Phytophthora infestans T30-4]EEY59918.1 conserved hypothetical protein [Phytophthora infestans T30-4]KAI9981335.1 hypothetical protein PInf_009031 [Phytophthora infestans]|eukprot:XP_002900603.1 conserved hypothetical protein [Phytophthora infestans T30-4]
MGGNLSIVCGLGASDSDPQLHYQRKDFARSFDQPTSSRGRSISSATDCSVASILSNPEQLVPDAYMPKDIQVLSQRRQRNGHHHHMASRSSFGFSGKNSSRVSSSSSKGLNSVRFAGNNAADEIPSSVNKKYNFGIKTASSSFGYSDDEPTASRGVDSSRLSMQELRVK